MSSKETEKLSLKKQSAWLLTAKFIGFAFSFVLPLVTVRHMAISEVGYYRESFQVIANAIVLLPLGFSMSSYYFLARETGERRGASILNILLFNFVVGGIACLFLNVYPQFLGLVFKNDELSLLAPLIGVVIWLWLFSTFIEIIAIANEEAKIATIFIVLVQITKTLLIGGAVIIFSTVESLLYAAMIQGVIQIGVLFWYITSRFPGFYRKFDLKFFTEQFIYAVPFGAAGILWMTQNEVHTYFVGHKFSAAEYAIYAYGCFEIPLITMLSESVTAVLIPRMNALQQIGDRQEMIRLTVRAMEKLAFVYFPVYVFMMITARTFFITLFTHEYEASATIFAINLSILPFTILITDPIVRSYKELGRLFLLTRIAVVICLLSALYYGIHHFSMTGMIIVAVTAVMIEKFIAESMVIKKLGLGLKDLSMLKTVLKTAVASLIAGAVTYFVYFEVNEFFLNLGEEIASRVMSTTKISVLEFVGGSLVMLISFAVFAPIYLVVSYKMGLIENSDRDWVVDKIGKFMPSRILRLAGVVPPA